MDGEGLPEVGKENHKRDKRVFKDKLVSLKPDWWNSIRAIIALVLVLTLCVGVFTKEVSIEKLKMVRELTVLALTFYFVLKKRPKENGGTQ